MQACIWLFSLPCIQVLVHFRRRHATLECYRGIGRDGGLIVQESWPLLDCGGAADFDGTG